MLEKEKCDLSRYRLQRAKELIIDAESLFERESYKSSNNRAYYAVGSIWRIFRIFSETKIRLKFEIVADPKTLRKRRIL